MYRLIDKIVHELCFDRIVTICVHCNALPIHCNSGHMIYDIHLLTNQLISLCRFKQLCINKLTKLLLQLQIPLKD